MLKLRWTVGDVCQAPYNTRFPTYTFESVFQCLSFGTYNLHYLCRWLFGDVYCFRYHFGWSERISTPIERVCDVLRWSNLIRMKPWCSSFYRGPHSHEFEGSSKRGCFMSDVNIFNILFRTCPTQRTYNPDSFIKKKEISKALQQLCSQHFREKKKTYPKTVTDCTLRLVV